MDLLFKLMDTAGPSGSEDAVRQIIQQEIKPYVDAMRVDTFGNLIAEQKGKGPRILLATHMDEVGLLVEDIDDDGKIHCSEIGWIEPLVLLGERVHIKTTQGHIYGILTTREISNDDEIKVLPGLKDLFVDTGLSKKELKSLGVEIGSYIHLMLKSTHLGSKEIIAGKAVDDRVGCYIVIELIKRLRNAKRSIQYAFTVQEEVGLQGAKTSMYSLHPPNWALIIDVTSTDDCESKSTKVLGKGPCLTIKDAEIMTNRKINEHIKSIAKKARIPLQLEVAEKGTTDAASISVSRGGIPSSIISIPIRNIHTTSSIVHAKDIEKTIDLIEKVLKDPISF